MIPGPSRLPAFPRGKGIGLVVYFIVAFANPFSGAAQIDPVRFERLYEGMTRNL